RALDQIRRQIDAEFDKPHLGAGAADGRMRRGRGERRRASRGPRLRRAALAGWLVAFALGAAAGGSAVYLVALRTALTASRIAPPTRLAPPATPVEPPPAAPPTGHDEAPVAPGAESTEALEPSRPDGDPSTSPTLPPRPLRPPPRSRTDRGGQR